MGLCGLTGVTVWSGPMARLVPPWRASSLGRAMMAHADQVCKRARRTRSTAASRHASRDAHRAPSLRANQRTEHLALGEPAASARESSALPPPAPTNPFLAVTANLRAR